MCPPGFLELLELQEGRWVSRWKIYQGEFVNSHSLQFNPGKNRVYFLADSHTRYACSDLILMRLNDGVIESRQSLGFRSQNLAVDNLRDVLYIIDAEVTPSIYVFLQEGLRRLTCMVMQEPVAFASELEPCFGLVVDEVSGIIYWVQGRTYSLGLYATSLFKYH